MSLGATFPGPACGGLHLGQATRAGARPKGRSLPEQVANFAAGQTEGSGPARRPSTGEDEPVCRYRSRISGGRRRAPRSCALPGLRRSFPASTKGGPAGGRAEKGEPRGAVKPPAPKDSSRLSSEERRATHAGSRRLSPSEGGRRHPALQPIGNRGKGASLPAPLPPSGSFADGKLSSRLTDLVPARPFRLQWDCLFVELRGGKIC